MHCDADPRADIVHLLVGFPFDAHRAVLDAQSLREAAAQLADPACKPGTLADHRSVDVDDGVTGDAQLSDRRREQRDGIGAAPFLVRIGEMRSDVAERRRAEKRIYYRMNEHIGVGMAFKPLLARKFHSAENQAAAFLEPMGIVTDTYSDTRGHRLTPF